jgi:hypothetical protein
VGSSPLRLENHRSALAGQVIAAIGAALSLLGPISDVIAGIGVAVLIIGVVVSAPAGRHPGPVMVEWWSVLAIAALAALIGFGLGFWLSALGGIILTAGAVVSLAAVFFGTPVRPE